jgi:proprotein convertase subtilisin/kexin type 5
MNFLYNSTCLGTCPPHFYPVSPAQTCEPCHSDCIYCTDSVENSCTECSNSFYLLNGSCYSSCPNYYFPETITLIMVCTACDSSCLTCSSSANTSCITCPPSLYFFSFSCLSSCPSNTFNKTNPINECVLCDNTCLTCSDSNP